MTTVPPTIDELAKVNPSRLEVPKDWSSTNALMEIGIFRSAVESVFGNVRWASDAGGSTVQARCSIPAVHKLAPENEFCGVVLSNFCRLFTVTYSWDVKPESLEQIVGALKKAEFRYVPVTLFADAANFDWKCAAASFGNAPLPSCTTNKMKNEDVWTSLFDYL
jgi:hypothetical protein